MPKVNLNREFVKNCLACPKGKKKIEFVSDRIPGFFVEVRATAQGAGTYYYRYTDGSKKMRTAKLGRTYEISFDIAKKKVKLLMEDIAIGNDPKADELRAKQIPTFREFFLESYLPHAKAHKRTWDNDLQMFNSHLESRFGHLKLNHIRKSEVMKFHLMLKDMKRSASTCNHYVKLVRCVLNHAKGISVIQRHELEKLKLFREGDYEERYMDKTEQRKLVNILRKHHNRLVANVVLFLLATGARRSEVFKAKWEHIDLENKLWLIPVDNAKSKKKRHIPLNDVALDAIMELGTQDTHNYVFPSPHGDKPLSCIKKTWERIRQEAGLPNLRLHDLRHQFASLLVNSGRSLYEVQAILGHSSPQVTQRYAHLSQENLQDATAAAAKLIR